LLALSLVLAVFALTPYSRVKADDDNDVTFTTIDSPRAIFSEAVDINSKGEIVGRFYDGTSCDVLNTCFLADGHNHGFLLRGGEFTTIDPPGSTLTAAVGINSGGDIVGTYRTADGTFHGFLLTGGEFSSIDFPGAIRTSAWRINAAGEIVGRYQSPDGKSHAFLLVGGEYTSIDFPGAFGALINPPMGINAQGDIVSNYCDAAPCAIASNGNVHGFLLSEGEFTSIDFPGSFLTVASAINNHGDIVGAYKDRPTTTCTISPSCSQGHGFLRTTRERDDDKNN
jgi:uncharacterized membrane protein